jgi:eukaryotic-like serine/threonine-protein kinase
VAEGLEYAHGQGIVHRDVKPGNVLVSPEGEAKLSDLGLAGPLAGESEADPRFGRVVGTADYLSPDQVLDPRHPAPAWDIYSLGCTLYYAVTGKVPFPGGTTVDKARAHCELRPLDPRRLNSRLTAEFVEVMADMMAKEPAERLASAVAVRERLATFVSGRPALASMPAGPAPPLPSILPAALPSIGVSPPLTAPRPPVAGAALADTKTDLSAEPGAALGEQTRWETAETLALAADGDEVDSSSREMQIPMPTDLLDVLWPLTVYVLAPAALVGTVLLLLRLVRSLL